ncbi:hypothetical protein [Mycolicibacterium sp. S3B2]|uniref:hypothetical protein n=1 Tax=Mycolicibacterium sp. S3B2 TaxID=3415120 RepID=UPI003C7CEDF2
MAQLSVWMGAGVVAAGMSAALIAGADTASADTDTTGGSASSVDSATTAAADDSDGESSDTDQTGDVGASDAGEDDADEDDAEDSDDTELTEELTDDASDADDESDLVGAVEDVDAVEDLDVVDDAEEQTRESGSGSASQPTVDVTDTAQAADLSEGDAVVPEAEPGVLEGEPGKADALTAAPRDSGPAEPESVSKIPSEARLAADTVAAQRTSSALSAPQMMAAPQPRTFQEVIQSLVMDIIGVAVRFVSGPPIAAPGTDVTVRSSRLEITEGRYVRADWYYPDTDEPPQRLIYLQHGYLGVGPMYSYTASWLAHRTNSIVVAPTLSSNRYVRDGFWLGDDQVYRATADMLLGDREALTASAVAAGFAKKYGSGAALPETFTLVGHSLGAGVAAGAAGYYADAVIASGATNRLAGIILLDGAPPGDVLGQALDKLDGLGVDIPVLELGAPREEGSRRVDEALNGHRAGRFNGIVLDEGQHLDSMQGGSWLIQLVSYLYQGFPTEQNKAAAQTIIAGWVNDIFAGRIDPTTGLCDAEDCAGIYAAPGQTVSIETPKGPATGAVIGSVIAPTSVEFQPLAATSLMFTRLPAIRLLIGG